jgi:hypothetical protein
MSTDAVILMIVAMVILWGGLILAIVRLNRHDLPDQLPYSDELHRDL